MNNSKFFENKKCEYYPCHMGMKEINCLFCYCPLFSICKIKDNGLFCQHCKLPHIRDNYVLVIEGLKSMGKKSKDSSQEGGCMKRLLNWFYHPILHALHRNKEEIMATKAEVLQAIADERAQVLAAVEDLSAQIQALKDQIDAGQAVTAADLDDIETAVHDIFVPAVPETPPAA
jgi:Zn-finger protein